MDDFNKQGMSVARLRAESILRKVIDELSPQSEQEKQHEAMAAKTVRLRQFRLAKEAAERDKESSRPLRQQKRKPRQKKRPSR